MFKNNSLKRTVRDSATVLILKISSSELNQNALQIISSYRNKGLLSCVYTLSSGLPSVKYDITGMLTLKEYLNSGIAQDSFFSLVSQICDTADFVKKSGLYINNLTADNLKNIFVEPHTNKIYFAYRPLNYSGKADNFYKLLHSMLKEADLQISDAGAVEKYALYLKTKNKEKNCDAFPDQSDELRTAAGFTQTAGDDENCTTELLSQQGDVDTDSGASTLLSADEPYLVDEKGKKIVIFKVPFIIGRTTSRLSADLSFDDNFEISGRHAEIRRENNTYILCDTNSKNGVYIGEKRIDREVLSDNMKFMIHNIPLVFKTGKEIIRDDESDSGTIQINGICSSYNNNGTLVLDDSGPCYRSFVEYVSAGEKYTIEKYPFVMGRDDAGYPAPDVDLKIKDNRTISLRHAKIDVRIVDNNPKFFIYDIHSSNGTFLEGERIDSEKAYELFSGCCFSLNKEEFRFYVDK
ncbi:MAG: FHA domain-containing protein [Oscillospiraceae bacterium]|nr:FHA domain-containing protein [Oscillospiraceae bacterium]